MLQNNHDFVHNEEPKNALEILLGYSNWNAGLSCYNRQRILRVERFLLYYLIF